MKTYDWMQSGQIDISARVYNALDDMKIENAKDWENLKNALKELDDVDVFVISFTIDTREAEAVVKYMTDTTEVMESVKKFVTDEKTLEYISKAVSSALETINDDDFKDNVEYYHYYDYDFYEDSSNFSPRSV